MERKLHEREESGAQEGQTKCSNFSGDVNSPTKLIARQVNFRRRLKLYWLFASSAI